MTFWEPLGAAGMPALWGALGLLPYYAALIGRRGRLPLAALPLAVAAGVVGALIVPALGAKGGLGVVISVLAALLAATVAVAAATMRQREAAKHRS